MNKFAVIDIGSNSVRLMFVADGKVLYKAINTTRLGEGLAQTCRLKTEAIERSALAVQQFLNRAIAEGAETVVAFATAAVRSAENGSAFVQRVKELCGLTVEVIAGETEAEIGILGALGAQDGAVLDIGGASTELVIKEHGELRYKKSINIGVVRLKDKCGKDQNLLYSMSQAAVEEFGQVSLSTCLRAIGGTATTIAAQVLELPQYDSAKITGAVIPLKKLEEKTQAWLTMPVEEIEKLPCMPKGRADVLAGGALLLITIMKKLGLQSFVASDRDNLEGYAIKLGLME